MQIRYGKHPDEEEKVRATPIEVIKKLGLKEIEVDEGFEIPNENLTEGDKIILRRIREYFGEDGNYPINFTELRKALYLFYKSVYGKDLHRVDTNILIRTYWRAGEFRRFVKGKHYKSIETSKEGRVVWHGVHYILYPKEQL